MKGQMHGRILKAKEAKEKKRGEEARRKRAASGGERAKQGAGEPLM